MIVLQGARKQVEFLQFAGNGRSLVAPVAGNVQLWGDVTAGGRPTTVGADQAACSARFTPDGRKLFLTLVVGVFLYDLSTGEGVEIALALPQAAGLYELSPDGQGVVVAQPRYSGDPRGLLACWLLADPTSPAWSAETTRPARSPPLFLAGGARFVLFEGRPDSVPFWYVTRDARTGRVLSEVAVAGYDFHSPVLSADRRLLAARRGPWAVVFRTEDFGTGLVRVLRNDNGRHFTGLAFHPSGRFLAATSNDATVKLYDAVTWEVAQCFDWDIGRLRSVAFSPDGMLAAAGGDKGRIVVWDVDL
jgi:WD40 repeat protein